MADAPAWKPDPEREDQERYWSGSAWTDRVRAVGKTDSPHLPEHVPHLQRALSSATAGIDAVEDRLSVLFERTEAAPTNGSSTRVLRGAEPIADEDEILDLYGDEDVVDGDQDVRDEEGAGRADVRGADEADEAGAFAELDAALAAEEPDEADRPKRRFFRRS